VAEKKKGKKKRKKEVSARGWANVGDPCDPEEGSERNCFVPLLLSGCYRREKNDQREGKDN